VDVCPVGGIQDHHELADDACALLDGVRGDNKAHNHANFSNFLVGNSRQRINVYATLPQT
jgi:hypothetical protein